MWQIYDCMNCCWRNVSAKQAARLSSKEEIRLVSLEEYYQPTPPPHGYPSWEDFLAKNEVFIEWVGSEWVVSNYGMSGREKTKHGTYPSALAAAKKEVGI